MLFLQNTIICLKHYLRSCCAHRLNVLVCSLLIVWIILSFFDVRDPAVPNHLRRYLWFPEGYTLSHRTLAHKAAVRLKSKLEKLNARAEVLNIQRFGPVAANTTVLAVQVHRGVERLQHLVISLAQARGIRDTLLVFSHSYYDESLNQFVRSIDFCRVMQVFYPYSLQLHPGRFPGVDPADGLSRDARRSEAKQHWWWKANFIFDGMNTTSDRVVVFLEEDEYVLPDFLYMLRYARKMSALFPSTEVLSLGGVYTERADDYNALLLDQWTPKYERGLAFNLSTWVKIKSKASFYCKYSYCQWSNSLMHVFSKFPCEVAEVSTVVAPRVLAAPARAQRGRLFPSVLRAVVLVRPADRRPRDNHDVQGCGDLRDRRLCLSMVKPETNPNTTLTPSISKPGSKSMTTTMTSKNWILFLKNI